MREITSYLAGLTIFIVLDKKKISSPLISRENRLFRRMAQKDEWMEGKVAQLHTGPLAVYLVVT